jgi:hypothetical protein
MRRIAAGALGVYAVWAVGTTLYIRYWERRWSLEP